eukprot:scaffold4368_cov169-Isochrysis_galbana.AAC.2
MDYKDQGTTRLTNQSHTAAVAPKESVGHRQEDRCEGWRFTSRAPLSLCARLRGPECPRRHNPPAVIGKGAQSCASRRLEWGEAVPVEPAHGAP